MIYGCLAALQYHTKRFFPFSMMGLQTDIFRTFCSSSHNNVPQVAQQNVFHSTCTHLAQKSVLFWAQVILLPYIMYLFNTFLSLDFSAN